MKSSVFVDTILQMDQPGAKQNIAVSQGIHLVLDKKFFPGNDAMMIPETSDGRVLFIVPWHNKLLMGTTDTPVKNISLEPVALETEIQFVLQTANKYLTVTPTRKDVLSVFAGLRPLAAAQDGAGDTKEISRSHKILVSPSALFSIIGGKWTTYRKMGEDMMDKVEKELKWEHVLSTTASLHIHGYTIESDQADPLYYYGNDETFIKRIIDETGNDWISEKLQINKAQAIWAIQHEMARTVEDFLSRRTRALLLDARESIRAAPLVARVMAKEMNKDESWVNDQIEFFKSVAKNYVLEN